MQSNLYFSNIYFPINPVIISIITVIAFFQNTLRRFGDTYMAKSINKHDLKVYRNMLVLFKMLP